MAKENNSGKTKKQWQKKRFFYNGKRNLAITQK